MLEASLDAPLGRKNLTVFPMTAPHGSLLPYLLSPEVGGKGILTVRERGDASTPMLLVRNSSPHPLLVLSGEPLPGEHPGRVVSQSFILGGKSVTQVPASAMERGGWMSPDQESEVTEWMASFPRVKHQVGIMAFLGAQIMGLEALGAPNLYEPLHRRLLVRFIKRAMRSPGEPSVDPLSLKPEAQRVLGTVQEAKRKGMPRLGQGSFWRLEGMLRGGELREHGRVIHLSIEPVPAGNATRLPSGG